jgi:hypothetical protein
VVDNSGKLTFRNVEVARMTTTSAILKSGIANGDMVVVSTLKAVTDGMRVRIIQDSGNSKS